MDTKPLTVQPTYPQVEKLIEERVMVAARKAGVGSETFQTALGVAGTELEDTIVSTVVRLTKPKPVVQHPPIDEWFDLEIDNTFDPMDVVTTAGYNKKGWTFLGPKFEGNGIRRVKLVVLGYIANLEAARVAAKAKGYRLLEGQAREPFKQKFPRHNGRPVVFGGNEWQGPVGVRHVACLDDLHSGEWNSNFNWSDNDFNDNWLWAVVEQFTFVPRYFSGVCFSSCLIQPPSIRPISLRGVASIGYFLLSSCFISQAICKKNFRVSSLPTILWTYGSFFSLAK
jgi:hypothetical protein